MEYKIKKYQYLIAASFIRSFVTLIATYIFTNFYSVNEFAIYNIIISTSLIISTLVSAPQSYFLSNNTNNKYLTNASSEILNLSISILLIIIAVLLLIYNISNFFFFNNYKTIIFIIATISFCLLIQVFGQNISRIEGDYYQFFKISVVERIVFILIFLATFFFNIKVLEFLLIYSIFSFFLFLRFIKKKILDFNYNFNFNFLKNKYLVRETTYALVNNIISLFIGYQALIIISGKMNELEITNAIAIGTLFLSLISLPLAWIETIVGPIISRIVKIKNIKFLNKFVNSNFKSTLHICFFLLTISLFLSRIPGLFEFFFYKYSIYKKVIFLFCFFIPAIASNIYISWFFICLNKNKYYLASNLILLVSLILIFFLVNFDLKLFIFYYILFSSLKIFLMNILFNIIYKTKFNTEIFTIYILTIINLFIYKFYDEYFNFIIFVNVIYLLYFFLNNKFKLTKI